MVKYLSIFINHLISILSGNFRAVSGIGNRCGKFVRGRPVKHPALASHKTMRAKGGTARQYKNAGKQHGLVPISHPWVALFG